MEVEFEAIACNRIANACDMNSEGLVCYAAGQFVGLYHPEAMMDGLLKGHSDRVTCVAFCGDRIVVSGSVDQNCIIWTLCDDEWRMACRFKAHDKSVVCVATLLALDGKSHWIATSASDGSIGIWKTNGWTVECQQRISTGRHHMMAMSLFRLPSMSPALVCGGTDTRLHLYVSCNALLELKLSLSGHSDWIRSIHSVSYSQADSQSGFAIGDVLIASASQDKHVRLWKITSDAHVDPQSSVMSDMMKAMQSFEGMDGWDRLSTKAHRFHTTDSHGSIAESYTVFFDALLMGHEDWVHTVRWQPASFNKQPMRLITASADKSILIWEPDAHSNAWIDRVRLGEVGGSTLGFYGALLSADGGCVVSNGYNGALHIWKRCDDGQWLPSVGVSGHSAPVEGIAWDPTGSYLLTTSYDQTTRAWAPWNRSGQPSADNAALQTWHEMARPQIHGYDLNCITPLGKYGFVSGADEKVVRVFEAPRSFAMTLASLSGNAESQEALDERPSLGANLPALGLSNKAVSEKDVKDASASHDFRNLSSYTAVASTPTAFSEALHQPPFEEHLIQHTLWPETDKLYGHGYEIVSVAANKQGTMVASASKATQADYATVRLWSCETWKEVCEPLCGVHSLTVTSIQFSPCSNYVLTAGRDRSWALYNISGCLGGDGSWSLEASQPKAHQRIIWSTSWTPDGKWFATGSRDKSVKMWGLDKNKGWVCAQTLGYAESVTSISFWPYEVTGRPRRYVLAVGFETGEIKIQILDDGGDEQGCWSVSDYKMVDVSRMPALTVRGLAWKPKSEISKDIREYLACCSEDYTVRLYSLPADFQ